MENSNYPTEAELRKIRKWNAAKDPMGLIEFIRELWTLADVGYFLMTGKQVIKLEMHSAGWSGNEDIIEALRKNGMFFPLYWEKSTRGGHYCFRIKKEVLKTLKEAE